ncbi:hypothetical protein V3C99_000471 [Haemonchus contortus]
MRQLLFLCFISLSFALFTFDTTEQPEDNPPVPMARLRKKGGRGDGTCTDESLRKIMNESMGEQLAETKRAVHRAVSRTFDGSFGVICAECAFSYIVHTHEYCVHTKNDITCLVYKDG